MKIFGFFYSEKVIFHKNKKNSIIVQQEEKLAIYTIKDDNWRIWDGRYYPDPARLFFSILKLVSFKKLNRVGRIWGNSQTRLVYILFLFLFFNFNFFIFFIYFYYIKINIFHKNKNIMNFYKLFIKKPYNNYYYLY